MAIDGLCSRGFPKGKLSDIAIRFGLLVEVLQQKLEKGPTGFELEFEKLAEVDRSAADDKVEFITAKLPRNNPQKNMLH